LFASCILSLATAEGEEKEEKKDDAKKEEKKDDKKEEKKDDKKEEKKDDKKDDKKKSCVQLSKDDKDEKDENSTVVCTNYTSTKDGQNKTECKDSEPGHVVFHFKDNSETIREVNINNSSANHTDSVWAGYWANQTA
jgi:hypothetical protein